ncbi:PTS ascorbate transporter subunit IIC [Vagococcus fluvialis]|jgi:PTS system ascorbate-specific IIC component|uniref:PTS ascorbate transporter subunit IIC n=1 Tax=Vagococcus fluvialis TaxID=2738 RepID=UPI000A33FD9E|nr:PTS ascorbate transporter subunit IIC [Vagococcus fluvialis]OTP33495.1 transporter SgaT [Enterococcus sp. 6C8_DIV0013]MBO0420637.1 PTS ascorbate transporter subunit IIC [Vagococcus fluvialis]NKC60619.1 PTS ascorbate transporter subunit IIC [Vagococcus fluvialis]NKD51397.1 PTS ascorbate transporter subunit IIC [Vagococcus fluvialis]UDM71171.1 PTS ascorbate transporter subunit IIC [Vagococcus fluvialis]
MKQFLDVLIDIASTPAILVGLIAVLGLVLQKKPIADVVRGGIKTFVGFLVVTAGAGVVVGSLEPFGDMFQHAFNMQGVVPNNEAIVAMALTKFGTSTALIMLAGMAFNILIARVTKFKYIYLTGHATLYMACMIAVIMSVTNMSTVLMILVGGLALGLANTIFPAIAQPFTKQITKNDTVAMGHTGSFGYALSGLIGKYVGNKEKSTEDIKFPKGLAFLRDSTVSITLTMGIVYIIVALFAGSAFITENLSGGTNYIIYALQQAGMFAAGVTVILTGVRLILAEIVPAFKGISEKLVPNSIPALDCPIVFPYAPNAVLIGFLTSFLGGIVSLFIMVFTGTTVIIPGVVPHFFCGATAGVYGNATGGIRGAVVGSFIHGIIISFMPLLLMPVLGEMGFQGSTFSDTDYGAVGIFLGNMANWGGQVLVIGAVLSVFAILVLLTIFDKNKEKKAA